MIWLYLSTRRPLPDLFGSGFSFLVGVFSIKLVRMRKSESDVVPLIWEHNSTSHNGATTRYTQKSPDACAA